MAAFISSVIFVVFSSLKSLLQSFSHLLSSAWELPNFCIPSRNLRWTSDTVCSLVNRTQCNFAIFTLHVTVKSCDPLLAICEDNSSLYTMLEIGSSINGRLVRILVEWYFTCDHTHIHVYCKMMCKSMLPLVASLHFMFDKKVLMHVSLSTRARSSNWAVL